MPVNVPGPPIVERVAVTAVEVPIDPPHRTASGLVAASPLILVDLHCAGALVGHAIVFAYTRAALKPLGDLVANLAEAIVGEPLAPSTLSDALLRRCRLLGTQGLVGMAIAGIDMAAWDAFARHRELPLCRLLGGAPRAVEAYGGTGYDGETETARQAERWAEAGYRAVKAKIGYPSVEEDRRVIRAMRQAVGDGVALMVDYNQSLEPVAAIERLRRLDEEGLLWVEEPVLAHDYAGTARVKDAVRTPVQSGENWWGPGDMALALAADASDYVMPDVAKIGGVSGWRRAVAHAESVGKQVSSHLWPELSAQLLAAGTRSHWLEYVDWWAPVLASPLAVENGRVVWDESAIGSGVDWNAEGVERYRV